MERYVGIRATTFQGKAFSGVTSVFAAQEMLDGIKVLFCSL
jgi:hypothetical protein